jgi:hypothetical protein
MSCRMKYVIAVKAANARKKRTGSVFKKVRIRRSTGFPEKYGDTVQIRFFSVKNREWMPDSQIMGDL